VKALVLRKPKDLVLADIPRPRLTEEYHALIRVEACGICGSDLRYWAGENPWSLHTLGRHLDNPPNMVMGHEFTGVVTQVNSSQFDNLLGKRVGVQAFRSCGVCNLCQSGHENLCKDTIHIGHAQGWGAMEFYPGAYAEYCIAFADLLHPIPEHITFAEAALRDILGVAVHAAGRSHIDPDTTILCIGGGPAGLSIAQVARAREARHIFISDPSPLAHRVIAQFPDFVCLDPRTQPLRDAIGARTCGAIFDTVGTAETMSESLSLLAETGTYVNLAVHDTQLTLNPTTLGSERTITTSSNALYRDEREAHQLISSGAVDMRSMITHRFPLDDFQEAFDLLLRDPKEAYKVVFEMGQ